MARTLLAQTLGSALVPGCLVLSTGAQLFLDTCPSSEAAWYLNLTLFAPLQQARAVPSPLAAILDRATPLELGLVLLLMAAVQLVRFRLGVAVFAHLAFAASILIARAWITDLHGLITPGLLLSRDSCGSVLVASLLGATGLACLFGHRAFIVAIVQARSTHSEGKQRRPGQTVEECRERGPRPRFSPRHLEQVGPVDQQVRRAA